ncbi:MAG: efflux RND transporter periplasmic adaptor subunit [Gammaproteobacteria bacterium]|nr:efflux RND transporter periplasmic adaptor subunit [Gammaproteobacteria bacterium]
MPKGVRLACCALLFFTATSFAAAPQPVNVSNISTLGVYPEISVAANSLSLNRSVISAQVGAVVNKLEADVGDSVQVGDVLLRFDDANYRFALQRAEAVLASLDARIELAESDLERTHILSQSDAVSQQNLRQRQSELKALRADRLGAQAAVELAKLDLQRCVIKAPFKAVITSRAAKLGELAMPGNPLFELVDSARIEVSAKLQAADAEQISSADQFYFSAQGKRYPLRLRALTQAFDPVERSREARFVFSGERALPGVAGNLIWRVSQVHLPADMLVRRDGKLGVFVIQQNRAVFVEHPGAREGRPVKSSLPADARIVTQGRLLLQHGSAVSVQ